MSQPASILFSIREQKKRISELEMELAAARATGFHPEFRLANASETGGRRALVVVGINTGFGQRPRRDSIRNVWMPTGGGSILKFARAESFGLCLFWWKTSRQNPDRDKIRDSQVISVANFRSQL